MIRLILYIVDFNVTILLWFHFTLSFHEYRHEYFPYVKHLACHLHVILLSVRIQVFLYSYFLMYFSETFSKFSDTMFARS